MNGIQKELRLKDFDISEETGFLPPTLPLKRLPGDYFSSWEDLCADLHILIKNKQLRNEVDKLPERQFNKETLKSEQEWRRAYVVLTFLSQAYIWSEGEAGVIDTLPRKLAVPFCAVAEHVTLPPVITYTSAASFNYGLRNPDGALDADNLVANTTFTGTEDESWFYMVPALMDLAAVPGLKAIEHAFVAMAEQRNDQLSMELKIIAQSVRDMGDIFLRMYERCAPLVFYLGFRPYQTGSKGIKAFPNGIVYEGVDAIPKQYHGASAAQNSSIPSIDVFLGVEHSGHELEFLLTMRKYQPSKHREFLDTLDHQPSVRDYVTKTRDRELITSYNMVVEAFGQLRTDHVTMVTRYIVNQRRHSVNASLDSTGTGGTPFMKFLKQVRDNTVARMIDTAQVCGQ